MNSYSKFLSNSIFLFILLFGIQLSAFGQFQKVINYNQNNGLQGNYSYGVFIDKLGYTWVSTENGLVRYNGYNFKLFSTKDGLPGNEVFALQEDIQGRVWLVPFANSVAFIKDDIVHNKENDSLLAKLDIESRPDRILCDRYGNVIIAERRLLTCISKEGKISKIKYAKGNSYFVIFMSADSLVNVCIENNIYKYLNNRLAFQRTAAPISMLEPAYSRLFSSLGPEGVDKFLEKAYKGSIGTWFQDYTSYETNEVCRIDNYTLAISRNDGCFLVDIATAKIIDTLLFGTKVGNCSVSKDGTLWVGTHGKGLFRYIKTPIKSLELNPLHHSVTHFRNQGDRMFIVMSDGRISASKFNANKSMSLEMISDITDMPSVGPFSYINVDNPNQILLWGSPNLLRIDKLSRKCEVLVRACKDVFEEAGGRYLLVSTYSNLLRIDRKNFANEFANQDVLLNSRTTSAAKVGNTIYAGTLNGLLRQNGDGQFVDPLPNEPSLKRHVTKLYPMHDSILWVANNHAELIALKGDQIIARHNENTGFNCNRVIVIKASKKYLWIGTNNGLYVLQNKSPFHILSHLTFIAGLNSNQINSVDYNDSIIWVGTPEGINYFNEHEIFNYTAAPKLVLKGVINGKENIDLTQERIDLREKTLRISFDVIDYYSGEAPMYEYKVNNDTNWIDLENNNIYFPTIPYGNFSVHIRAVSPNWQKPEEKIIFFSHSYPFYLQLWFIVSSLISFVTILIIVSAYFVKKARKKDKVKITTQRNLLNLEQMALQAQMNPHFIFNCMVAIKQYYNAGNTEKANEFVDSFASLIRQAFEMGGEPSINLEQELNYLNQYLAIEQKRFDYSFDYTTSISLEQSDKMILIPTMILQPIVENAVRHGLRNITGRRGMIQIEVREEKNYIIVTITDNGVGRKRSMEYRRMFDVMKRLTSENVTQKRIRILNQLFTNQISLVTEDVLNESGEVCGTKVTLSYPRSIFVNQAKNQ